MPATRPTYEDVMEECHKLTSEAPALCKFDEIGKSAEGRPIPLLTLTDPAVPVSQKPVIYLTGGTHGSEEVGRASTLALARWLLSDAGRPHLKKQVVLICPCVNPDGAVRNTYHNAQDININRSYRISEDPTVPEARAVYEVARQWIPDCYVDVHGLAGGAIGDSEYVYMPRPGNALLMIALAIARQMDAEAEKAGFPQRFPRGLRDEDVAPTGTSLCRKLLYEDNALVFTVETTENYYPLEDSIKSAMARLTTLLKVGENAQWYHPYPGYPCDIIAGDPVGMLMPYGSDYQQRRINRRKTTRCILSGGITRVSRLPADPDKVATVRITVEKELADQPDGYVIQLNIDPRAEVKRVTFNGSELQPSATDGYEISREYGFVTVRASIPQPLRQGDNDLQVYYSAPFEPHSD